MHRSRSPRRPAGARRRTSHYLLFALLATLVAWSLGRPLLRGASPLPWGLDLSGGLRVVYRPDFETLTPRPEVAAERMAVLVQAKEILASRLVRSLSTVPDVVVRSDERIVVSLPGDRDQMSALSLIGKTYRLTWRLVESVGVPGGEAVYQHEGRHLRLAPVRFSGDMLDARGIRVATGDPRGLDPESWSAQIAFRFRAPHDRAFEDFTRANAGREMAILIDDQVEWIGVIQGPIAGEGALHGGYTVEEATAIAHVLRAGTLPIALTVEDVEAVGPSLGRALRERGWHAAALAGFLLVGLLTVAYGHRGDLWLAGAISATLLLTMIVALASWFQLTVDLAAVAGLVLSVGMGVDAFVLVFEALQADERDDGGGPRRSADGWHRIRRVYGFAREGGTLFHANATTLLVVSLLLGADRLRSFALFMVVGIAGSLLTILATRAILERLPSGWRAPWDPLAWLRRARPGLFRARTLYAAVLLGVFVLPMLVPSARWALGADFRAGTQLQVRVENTPGLESLRASLLGRWPDLSMRTQQLGDPVERRFVVDLDAPLAFQASDASGGDGDLVLESAVLRGAVSSAGLELESLRTVDPKVSSERLLGSLDVLGLSFLFLGLYLIGVEGPVNRFFGVRPTGTYRRSLVFAGVLLAVLLDVAVVLAVLASLGLSIGLPAVAALLTVVGYSVNDSVVLWGQVRREHAKSPTAEPVAVVTAAADRVLSRQVLTSASTAIPAIALLVVGLEPLRAFAWAILAGTVAGTLSSIFVVGRFAAWALVPRTAREPSTRVASVLPRET